MDSYGNFKFICTGGSKRDGWHKNPRLNRTPKKKRVEEKEEKATEEKVRKSTIKDTKDTEKKMQGHILFYDTTSTVMAAPKQTASKPKSHTYNDKTNQKSDYPFGVSICISAWKTQDYIEECLDSVANQTWFKNHDNWEILLGIDGCEETLTKVKEIMHKYKNLRVMMMDRNVGTYVTCNTIMQEAKYEWLLRFDSDDAMLPNLVETCMKEGVKNDITRLLMENFTENGLVLNRPKIQLSYGSTLSKKNDFIKYGGYIDWLCDGDSERLTRLKNVLNIGRTENVVLRRRLHSNQLTTKGVTKFGGEMRNEHKLYQITESVKTPFIETVTTSYKLEFDSCIKDMPQTFVQKYEKKVKENSFVYENTKNNALDYEDGISVIISAYKSIKYIKETIDSINSQKTTKNYEILIGVDGDVDLLYYLESKKSLLKNTRIFYYPINLGPYLIFNSMVLYAKYNKILRFDSDDLMPDNFLEKIFLYSNDYDAVKTHAINFGFKNGELGTKHGSFLIKKEKFIEFGGFMPWCCDADGEIFDRTNKVLKWKIVENLKFKRRIHENNLINDKDKGLKSDIRKRYRTYRKNVSPSTPIVSYTIIKLESSVNKFCPIVSFTTYSKRLATVNDMIASLLKQTYKPFKIVCNITQEDFKKFPEKYKKNITFNIIPFDLRPHNKYYWTMIKYKKNPIITVDDDCVYNKDTIKMLMDSYLKNENSIFSLRAHRKTFSNGILNPYEKWEKSVNDNNENNLFVTGVGGVLYPPNILNVNETWLDIVKKYITVDDIVLHYFELKQNIKIAHIKNNIPYVPIKESQKVSLYHHENVSNNNTAVNELLKPLCSI